MIIGNPLSWFLGLFAVILSLILMGGRFFFGLPVKNEKLFWNITFFSGMYTAYMIGVMTIDRVMYLYHYFIPLLFSFILAYLVFQYLFEEYIVKKDRIVLTSMIIIAVEVAAVFAYFCPLTYYQPLTVLEFYQRVWSPFWGMNYVGF